MKPIPTFALLLFLFSRMAIGQVSPATTVHAPARFIPLTEMQQDFDALRKAIEEVHGGLYRFLDKEGVDRLFHDSRQKLVNVKDKSDFIAIVSETLAGLRDGHMRLEYDPRTTEEIVGALMLPLQLTIESNRLVVVFNETPTDATIVPGMEVISVNGNAAKDLIGKITSKISGDGFIETGKIRRAERNFAQHYWMFVDPASEFAITAKNVTGKTINSNLSGVSNAVRVSNRNKKPVNAVALRNVRMPDTRNIRLQFIENASIASIRIRGFEGADFKENLDSVFLAIRNKKSNAVILDLRGNGGGVDDYGAYLVSQFTEKSFRYFDHIHLRSINPSFTTFQSSTYDNLRDGTVADPNGGYLVTTKLHSGVGEQQPGRYPFVGKLVVLMNGLTFSTAADVTATLRHQKRAEFVGEECGGGYEGNTSGMSARVNLPHSKLSLRISMYEYWNAVELTGKGRGTLPDHAVDNRMTDILRGVDAQWNMALELARKAGGR